MLPIFGKNGILYQETKNYRIFPFNQLAIGIANQSLSALLYTKSW